MSEVIQTISRPQSAILSSTKAVNLFLAGVGSGKTFLGGIISYRFISQFPKCTGFVAANTFEQLNLSTLFRIREYWKSIGITEWSKDNPGGMYVSGKQPPSHFNRDNHNFESYNSIISFVNGAIIFTGSLENSRAHEGKQFSWCILDETKDSREVDIKEIIIARLRQQGLYIKDGKLSHEGEDFNPLYILTSPARVDWINEWFSLDNYIQEISDKIYSDKTFFQKEFGNKFVTISSTYHNSANLPSTYIQNIKDNNTDERFKALVYSNPFISTGGEFYSSFNRLKHVITVKYDPSLPIHLSFDQNTVPYNSCGISQVKKIGDLWYCYFIDEIALENPRNSTEEVCEEFMMRYPRHNAGLFYYGDASGKNRSTMNKDFKHHYEIVAFKLRKYLNNGSDRTLFSNPSLVKRRDFVNLILEEKLPIRVFFDESCKKMIADMMYTKQALDGGKDKHIVTDKDTGEKYQKYGHMGDLFEYQCVELFKNYYNG
jgi:hypothetical protein